MRWMALEFDASGLICDKRSRLADGIIDNPGAAQSRARKTGLASGMSGFSLSSEPFTLMRDCSAVMVPQGDTVTLPAGQIGYITQALGGSFTVYVEGNLFRIAGNDADALGKERPAPIEVPDDATNADVEKLAWDQLRTVFDPEIPVNIYELGLVYDLDVDSASNVHVRMTLTAPACPAAQTIPVDVERRIREVPGVNNVKVSIVWDPPWTRDKMSEVAKLTLGMY